MANGKSGRPSTYTPELAKEICSRLIDGKSLRAVCEDEDMPARSTVLRWLAADIDGFESIYAQARIAQLMGEADEILEIADNPEIGQKTVSKATGMEITEGDMIEHRRLKVATRQWLFERMMPRRYGNKQQLEHSGSVSIADSLSAAKRRMADEKAPEADT